MKELLKDKYKVALYTGDTKEVKLNNDGLFEEDVDVIISTSSIQNEQSIKENILSIFVQTYFDTVSSVKQFLGRNCNRDSDVILYVRYRNRYERYLNKLHDTAWNCMIKINWDNALYKFGHIWFGNTNESDNEYITDKSDNEHVVDKSINEHVVVKSDTDKSINEYVVDKPNIEFTNKRDLYNYYGIDIKTISDRYKVKMRYNRIKGKLGRVYKLIRKWNNNVFLFFQMTVLT